MEKKKSIVMPHLRLENGLCPIFKFKHIMSADLEFADGGVWYEYLSFRLGYVLRYNYPALEITQRANELVDGVLQQCFPPEL